MARLLASLLVLMSVAAAAGFASLDAGGAALLGWTLIGAVVVTSLARPFRGAGLVAAILGAVFYFGIQLYQAVSVAASALEPHQLAPGLEGALLLAGVGLLAELTTRRLHRIGEQVRQDTAVIQELTPHDSLTGTLKSSHLHKLLTQEMERARRYQRSVSVVLLEADDWPVAVRNWGQERATAVLRTVAQLVMKGLRSMDTVSRIEEFRFLIVLPETPVEGAQQVAERLCKAAASQTGLSFRSGVAEFPGDAVSTDELIAEARAALKFAQSAGMTVASRRLLA